MKHLINGRLFSVFFRTLYLMRWNQMILIEQLAQNYQVWPSSLKNNKNNKNNKNIFLKFTWTGWTSEWIHVQANAWLLSPRRHSTPCLVMNSRSGQCSIVCSQKAQHALSGDFHTIMNLYFMNLQTAWTNVYLPTFVFNNPSLWVISNVFCFYVDGHKS